MHLTTATCPRRTPTARRFAFIALCALALSCGEEASDGGRSPLPAGDAGDVEQSEEVCTALPGATGAEPDGLIPLCCPHSPEEQALADEVLKRLNDYRREKGLSALALDAGLAQAIQGHCRHMAAHAFFAHEAPEPAVASPWARAEQCGSVANGENIAAGQPTAAAVMESWKKSPGHNANMLNDGFRRVGIGACFSGGAPYAIYWGQLFGM